MECMPHFVVIPHILLLVRKCNKKNIKQELTKAYNAAALLIWKHWFTKASA
jgi:hypothetical protein